MTEIENVAKVFLVAERLIDLIHALKEEKIISVPPTNLEKINVNKNFSNKNYRCTVRGFN